MPVKLLLLINQVLCEVLYRQAHVKTNLPLLPLFVTFCRKWLWHSVWEVHGKPIGSPWGVHGNRIDNAGNTQGSGMTEAGGSHPSPGGHRKRNDAIYAVALEYAYIKVNNSSVTSVLYFMFPLKTLNSFAVNRIIS
ncbi:hypothetical protein QFZ48_005876 [Chitinophaga sp. W2I13]|uniref:hypothetical protein n=1 Tax=Chitinophaga sp. W2I13 TaxID=3373923 RepID=UPI003D20E1B5